MFIHTEVEAMSGSSTMIGFDSISSSAGLVTLRQNLPMRLFGAVLAILTGAAVIAVLTQIAAKSAFILLPLGIFAATGSLIAMTRYDVVIDLGAKTATLIYGPLGFERRTVQTLSQVVKVVVLPTDMSEYEEGSAEPVAGVTYQVVGLDQADSRQATFMTLWPASSEGARRRSHEKAQRVALRISQLLGTKPN